MGRETLVRSKMMRWLSSHTRQKLVHLSASIERRVKFKEHEVLYFHRADDPYCQLMVQILPEFAKRFQVKIRPKVVERLPVDMYPDPARFEAYSIIDAARLARLYGLGFPVSATVPDRLSVGMTHRYLANLEDDERFFAVAEELGGALWRQNVQDVQRIAVQADIKEEKLATNEKLLRTLGHYSSGVLYYGGEFYQGLDRVDHLERRLNEAGLGDGEIHFDLQREWRRELGELVKTVAGRSVDFFFSVRSPYSYLALELVEELTRKTGIMFRLRPVLPMMMRGMKVPPSKGRYIMSDVGREARREGIGFGNIHDPLGSGTRRALAIGFAVMQEGYGLDFFLAFTRAVWSQGIDGSTDEGLEKILKNAGLSPKWISAAFADKRWERLAEANQQELFAAGSWGVPTFRVDGQTLWGQDRIWAILEVLKQTG